jgi:vanillate monooxygenase ferredoxin subunit
MTAAGNATIEVIVQAQVRASERALLLELRAIEDHQLPTARAGAHLDLHVDRFIRQYSLLEPNRTDRYLICVQHEPNGRGGSNFIHKHVRVGDHLHVSRPRNTFELDLNQHHAVLLAGGIGVTPLLSMASELEAREGSYELHCYARRETPLEEYIQAQPYAHSATFYNTERDQSLRHQPPSWTLTDDTIVYACGPPGFLEAARRHAAVAGIAGTSVRNERFTTEQPIDLAGDAFTVVASSTGERMLVTSGETIADVLTRHGYEVALSCEQGICGACLTRVCDGVPDHRDEIQTAAEHATNAQINVCVSRSRSAVLTLDIQPSADNRQNPQCI